MQPGAQDLIIYQGDTFAFTFRLRPKNNDGTLGDPEDLTGYTGLAQARDTVGGTTIKMSFVVTIPDQSGDGQGTATLSLSPTITAALVPTTAGQGWPWDVQLTDPAGFVRTYLRGQVTVIAEISHP